MAALIFDLEITPALLTDAERLAEIHGLRAYYAGMEVAQGCTDPKSLKSRTECRFM